MVSNLHIVALILCLGLYEASAGYSYLELYRSTNWDKNDKWVSFNANVSDLAALDFDNQAHSFAHHGLVILYPDANFNTLNPYAGWHWFAGHVDGSYTGGNSSMYPILPTVSSVRFIGSFVNNIHVPSLTLFTKTDFAGITATLILGSTAVLERSDYQSVINFGLNEWTFYDQINFNGKGHCIQASTTVGMTKAYDDSTALGFSLVGKLSVERGCWATHGVPGNSSNQTGKSTSTVFDFPNGQSGMKKAS